MEQTHTGQGRHTHRHTQRDRQTQRERCILFLWRQGKPAHLAIQDSKEVPGLASGWQPNLGQGWVIQGKRKELRTGRLRAM